MLLCCLPTPTPTPTLCGWLAVAVGRGWVSVLGINEALFAVYYIGHGM